MYDLLLYRLLYVSSGEKQATIHFLLNNRAIDNWHSNEIKDCMLDDAARCRQCLHKVRWLQAETSVVFANYSRDVMTRFDCRPKPKNDALQTSDEVEYAEGIQFTSNSTCVRCKEWYQKWLLVARQTEKKAVLEFWKKPPCFIWCYYAELVCPFLNREEDQFAGMPVFRCVDAHILIRGSDAYVQVDAYNDEDDCTCLHPCDVMTNDDLMPEYSSNEIDVEPIFELHNNTQAYIRQKLGCAERAQRLAQGGSCWRFYHHNKPTSSGSMARVNELLILLLVYTSLPAVRMQPNR